jgi:hypothetical protein
VYPVCNVLNWGKRISFFAGLFAIAVLLYFVGEFFNNKIWGEFGFITAYGQFILYLRH